MNPYSQSNPSPQQDVPSPQGARHTDIPPAPPERPQTPVPVADPAHLPPLEPPLEPAP